MNGLRHWISKWLGLALTYLNSIYDPNMPVLYIVVLPLTVSDSLSVESEKWDHPFPDYTLSCFWVQRLDSRWTLREHLWSKLNKHRIHPEMAGRKICSENGREGRRMQSSHQKSSKNFWMVFTLDNWRVNTTQYLLENFHITIERSTICSMGKSLFLWPF